MTSTYDLYSVPSLYFSQLIATAVSIFGSCWMLSSSVRIPNKTPISILVIWVAIADLIYALPNAMSLFGYGHDSIFCKIEGFSRELFLLSLYVITSGSILCYKDSLYRFQGVEAYGPQYQKSFVIKAISFSIILSIALAIVYLS